MKNVRLPAHIKPERYQLTIKPDLEGFTFFGEEKIYLALAKSSRQITLHAKELKIWDVEFQISNYKFQTKNIVYNQKAETATFIFNKKIPEGKGILSLKFEGVLNDKMRGFYRSRYTHNGKERHMATTQFEATDARRAFPCFDEPAHKAVFDVTMVIPKGLTAISNTIETSIEDYPHPGPLPGGEGGLREHQSGYNIVKFAPTPKMSTYLLAFIVGDFEFIEARTRDGVLVRIFVTPGKKHQAKFALDTAVKVLEFYNEYFNIPYPLPVLDLIAIPDFSHGAMENWGLITFRETTLLADPKTSSIESRQIIALVVCHELSHQWFGNLVTMKWWDDLWLNESFANLIEYRAVDALYP
ncbi:MAG: M1 family metallopeptidase, partial [Candidatus Paceibacterales bacterium]